MKKIHEKLKGYGCYEEIHVTMSEVIHQSLTVKEFEDNWTGFVNSYCLGITNGCKGCGMIADARVEKEATKNFDSLNKVMPCCSNSEIEVQFQSEYTNDIF
ncbi:hypothetical protein AHAS_Ahas20G0137800 [Arachis hypogaea]